MDSAMVDTNASEGQVLTLGVNDLSDSYLLAFTSSYICGGKTFEILVTENPPPGYDRDSTEVRWTEQLNDLSMHDGTDIDKSNAQDYFMQKLAYNIRDIALPKMLELAPPAPGSPPPTDPLKGIHTVQEHLFPDKIKLQLVSRDSCFELIHGHHTELHVDELKPISRDELQNFGVEDISSLPTYSASDVLLLSRLKNGMSAYDATDLGRTEKLVCKLPYHFCRKDFLRELNILAEIRKAKSNVGLKSRVSQLKALVMYGDGIVGMLIEKIPTRFETLDDVLTGKVDMPLLLRKQWAAQIENTVEELHRHDIVWGDAKPQNIVIDECDNTWLIDFGGGFSRAWVEPQLAETVEGDLQAVKKMREKLENE
ncbi:hypothetical protein V8F33_013982 [Rhypophila sp. PSN 637]